MDLKTHLSGGLELDQAEDTDATGVFMNVADLIARERDLDEDARDAIRDAFIAREKAGSTAFGFGIAVPHVFSDVLEGISVAVCRLAQGIDMGAIDGEPTNVLICVAAPESERETYLALLKQVAQVTREPRWRRFIQQSSTAAAVRDVLEEATGG